jgi:WD40 repeat protein
MSPGAEAKDLFAQAYELEEKDREAFLESACGGDAELRLEVKRLLVKSEKVDAFFADAGGDTMGAEGFDEPISEREGDHIGVYILRQKIGEGGFGVVWMAEQSEPISRMVALKVVKAGMDTREVLVRFQAERQALAMMEHPNIAKILDVGATPLGRPYFAMELVKGIPITDFCKDRNYGPRETLTLFLDVCSAVSHAHQKGIIHRDLKPSNVMVTLHGDKPVVKVIDFGIAKATQDKLTEKTLFTRFEQFLGTPVYMSPEQAAMSGLDIDTRSDIYGLGVLLYELLAGKPPFDSKTLISAGYDEMRRIIKEDEPPKPSTRLAQISSQTNEPNHPDHHITSHALLGELDWIVMKAIEKDRVRRYETANGFANDIGHYLNNEPVEAAAPSSAYKFRKFVQRNRGAFAAAAVISLVLVIATVSSTWLALKATEAKQALGVQLSETSSARQAEMVERVRAESSLQRMQIQQAEEYLGSNNVARGVARLADLVRTNPNNRVAAERLLSVLTQRSFPLPQTEPLQHEGPVYSVRYSPNGKWVITASRDGTARVWDVDTGLPLFQPFKHDDSVRDARFSPDGRRVVTASVDHSARVWDVLTGEPIGEPLRHEGPVYSARFSPDGRWIVTASHDQTARVWDARTGQPLTAPLEHKGRVDTAQFSPDGNWIVTSSFDYTARVWDARTGLPLFQPFRHSNAVTSARFSPDGNRVLTASQDQTAQVWEVRTGRAIGYPLRHPRELNSAEFSPDGNMVVTASHDDTARVWDAHTGQAITLPLRHQSFVLSARFSPDGQMVVTTSSDQTARVWDARSGEPLHEIFRHEGGVNFARFSPDGGSVVTASVDQTARIWDIRPGQVIDLILPHLDQVSSAQFSPDGQRVVTASADETARVWDVSTGRAITPALQHEGKVELTRFSPAGERVLTACGPSLRMWDARSGQLLTVLPVQAGLFKLAEFSPDGKRIVIAPRDQPARVWDVETGKPITPELRHGGMIMSAQFSPDGGKVVTCSRDQTARVWDARTGQLLTDPFGQGGDLMDVKFSFDGQRVVTASTNNTAQVWDALSGKAIGEPLQHQAAVMSAEFSPDGRMVLTASYDRTAIVWNARTGKALNRPLQHQEPLNNARFSPDGRRVATACWDGFPRVWDVRTGHLLSVHREGGFSFDGFSPDGQRVALRGNPAAGIWEVPLAEVPAPAWLARLAEVVAGVRLNTQGVPVAVPVSEFFELKEELAALEGDGFYEQFAKWFLADRSARARSPFLR